jgi:L,D-peptidoglycan transpeptidase YkuD (ErfK/YbiS/YcfS/YnhG family)
MIDVRARPGETQGTLWFAGRGYFCALGRAGVSAQKREGDGATPQGRFFLRELRYRADRIAAPTTLLPAYPIDAADGWSDDPADSAYNRLVKLPHPASAEALMREDSLYDALVVLGHNDDPVVPGAGSAIFLHVAKGQAGAFEPTAGCVALPLEDLLRVLSRCGPRTQIDIRLV